ncbi:hypothetical protein Patl1_22093 [Pistacia atlantica]|uniref:Uncharacterized protein n=1 Tax=Pistacia atlantica TaxID=434234 RepID=A0ACC1BNV4_9ROSI|nr:hypothetical protein Patl1_22093 [Pistacia atlantica]
MQGFMGRYLEPLLIENLFLIKCQFKDEFVTAGGASLSEDSLNTMESKVRSPERIEFMTVLNVDGVTGGFNFRMLGLEDTWWEQVWVN